MIRHNTNSASFEGYSNGAWSLLVSSPIEKALAE